MKTTRLTPRRRLLRAAGCGLLLICCGLLLRALLNRSSAPARDIITVAAVSGEARLFDRLVGAAQLHKPDVITGLDSAALSRAALAQYLPQYQSRIGKHSTLLASHALVEAEQDDTDRPDVTLLAEQAAEELMHSIDHNKDHVISRLEFQGGAGYSNAQFLEYDQNADGMLDSYEIEKWELDKRESIITLRSIAALDLEVGGLDGAPRLALTVMSDTEWDCDAVAAAFPEDGLRGMLLIGRMNWQRTGCLSKAPLKPFRVFVTPGLDQHLGIFMAVPSKWTGAIKKHHQIVPSATRRLVGGILDCSNHSDCGPGAVCGCGQCSDASTVE